MVIEFYSTKAAYGEFSNFAAFPIEMDGLRWPTTEHYFQAQKFEDESYREKIRLTASPMLAARLGRSRQVPLRADWEQEKDEVMYRAVKQKFSSYPQLRTLLLETGEAQIIEKTSNDYYWGCGTRGDGKNRLGEILMHVRDELR
jgi:ribA/ribD-fused uncharacterized protein